MTVRQKERKIAWYRSPVSKEALAALNTRSDLQGLLQTLGHLGLLALTGGAAIYATGRYPWPVVLLILFLHGTGFAFLLNGFHELCHKSVFKTKSLNTFFLHIISFLSWNHPVMFWASHQEHHKYTLHPPEDLEVVLPIKLTLKSFLKSALINPWDFYGRLKFFIRLSQGKLVGEWENYLFPPAAKRLRSDLITWARYFLVWQALIIVVSLLLGWWMVPVVVTLAPFYGGWLLYLCNNTQHVGLMDNTPDFRLCTRTILLNPVVRFLYWHMNYHIEHHMYAAVPCYHLGKLHDQIKDDLPPCPKGLVQAWKEIVAILKQQQVNPSYQYLSKLPAR